MADLRDPRLIILKAVLFVVLGVFAAVLLLVQSPTLRTAALLAVCVWAFARAYYFCFHVIEKYVAPGEFKFAGLFSAFRFLATRGRRSRP